MRCFVSDSISQVFRFRLPDFLPGFLALLQFGQNQSIWSGGACTKPTQGLKECELVRLYFLGHRWGANGGKWRIVSWRISLFFVKLSPRFETLLRFLISEFSGLSTNIYITLTWLSILGDPQIPSLTNRG